MGWRFCREFLFRKTLERSSSAFPFQNCSSNASCASCTANARSSRMQQRPSCEWHSHSRSHAKITCTRSSVSQSDRVLQTRRRVLMSLINGDKARDNRRRKKLVKMREKREALKAKLAGAQKKK